MILITETKQYVTCPECGENSGSEFIEKHHRNGFGPWWCDECGVGYVGKVGADGAVALELTGARKIETTDLLEIPPQRHSIYLATTGMRFTGKGHEEEGNKHYFYEEHTCPTNWLRDVFRIQIDGDSDPHGIAEYVASVDGTPDWEDRDEKFAEVMKVAAIKTNIAS